MYNLMLVDDEPIVLKAISHLVETHCPQLSIVAKTGSGLEAVSLALQHKPDVIMMDIELAGLNGLEAVEEIKATLPETLVIIISAYDNFYYAQKSIALGVMDYLLKPVSKDDVIRILNKAVDLLEKQRGKVRQNLELKEKLVKIRPYLEEELFFSLLYPGIRTHPLNDYPHLLDLQCNYGQAVEMHFAQKDVFVKNIERYKQVMRSNLQGVRVILFGPLIGKSVPVLLGYDNMAEDLQQRYEQIYAILKQELDQKVSILLGPVLTGVDGMIDSFRRLHQLVGQQNYTSGVWWAEQLSKPEQTAEVIPWQIEQDFFRAIEQGNCELARWIFVELHQTISLGLKSNVSTLKDYYQGIVAVLQRIFHEVAPESVKTLWDSEAVLRRITRIEEYGEFTIVFEKLISEITGLIGSDTAAQNNPEIRAAIGYMQQNYQHDITLTDIATAIPISPGYLTKIFKEYRNQTVMDYLERIRMEQALKLLKETHYSIKEISSRVGYKDPNYFSKVFKKVTNVSPTELRG